LLGVETEVPAAGEFGLLVDLSGSCAVTNDTCSTALDLTPELGTRTLEVWPMCGDDSITSACQRSTPSPDIFYRLDLTRFSERVHVVASATRVGEPLQSLVLMAADGESCGAELWCGDFDLWLEPDVYYVALDAFRDQQGPVELSVTLAVDDPPAPASCIDEAVAVCARRYDCCEGDRDECWLAYLSCGLAREALDCLCAAQPSCCDGRRSSADCGTVLRDCGTFCPDFDPAFSCAP
jgi:hypothetical protein